MKLLADDMSGIFGKVKPPPGTEAIATGNPVEGLAKLFALGIKLFITGAGMILLVYLLWGAIDWITSNGEKERIAKAQNKITNALIGMVLIFVVLTVYGVIAGDILGIIKRTDQGWEFKISTYK